MNTHRALQVGCMATQAWEEKCAPNPQGSADGLHSHPGPGEVTSKECPSFWQHQKEKNCKLHESKTETISSSGM